MTRLITLLLPWLLLPLQAATSRLDIPVQVGTNTVAGRLELPLRAEPHPVILFATDDGPIPKEVFTHPEARDARQAEHHAIGRWDRFTRMGFACFSWDKPGTGESPGDWSPDTAGDRAAEILAALATLRKMPGIDTNRVGIWCHAQAARALGPVLAKERCAFIVTVSPPVRTPLEQASDRLRTELESRGIDPVRIGRATQLLLRKWEMIRSGIPYTALTRHIAEERPILGDADHPWLAPFSPAEFTALTGPRRAELESWFDTPFRRLRHLDVPVLAFFGHDDPDVPNQPTVHPHLNIVRFADADHRMQRTDGSVTPGYWSALETFFDARFPEVGRRAATAARTAEVASGELTAELRFLDEASLSHELNLLDLTRRAMDRYQSVFGGPPRDASGAPAQRITIEVESGHLAARAAPTRVELTIGREKAFGYLDWRMTFLHELAHLWIGHSFKPVNELETWFNEGATEYLAFKTGIRLGLIPAAEAPDLLTRSWASYIGARGIGELSLRDAGRADRRAHYFLLYHGGLTACMVLDYQIRRHTDNRADLYQLFRRLHDDTTYDANSLVQHIGRLTGQDFAPFFRDHIAGTRILPVGRYITRMEVEALRTGQQDRLPETDRRILEGVFELEHPVVK